MDLDRGCCRRLSPDCQAWQAEEVGELDSLAFAAAEGAAVLAEGYVAQTDVVQGHEFGGDADGCGLSCG